MVDDLPLAAAPLEGGDSLGLQEWGGDDGLEEHGRLAVIPDCVLEPAALQPEGAQPFQQEVLPPGAGQPWKKGPDDLPWIQQGADGILIQDEGGAPFAGKWRPGNMKFVDRGG